MTLLEEGEGFIVSKNYRREQKEQKVAPQNRTETINLSIELKSKDAEQYTVGFNNRYYNQPIVIDGISAASYLAADGTLYKTHFVMSIKEFLKDPNNNLFVGAVIYVRAANLPNKLSYPITGYLPLLITGKGTEKYLGALEDAIPVIPEDSTGTDNDEILENDPPPNVTGLSLSTGTYLAGEKGQTPIGYIKATWNGVIHNDLQGYESDISESDNLHYDELPDPKFNSAEYMVWDNLKLNTLYYIKVRAIDLAGNTSPLWTETPITVSDGGTIEAPTLLTVSTQPPLGAVVTWVASISDKIFSYEVYRADVSHGAAAPVIGDASKVAETNSTFFFDDNLTVTQDYYYWVRAVGTNGVYSDWTAISDVLVPVLITDLSVEADALYDRLTDGSVDAPKLKVGAVTANKIYAGTLTAYQANFVNRYRGCDVVFTVSNNVVYWTAGTLKVAKATYSTDGQDSASWGTVNITNSSGNQTISGTTYFYINWTADGYGEPNAASGVSMSVSTTYPTSEKAVVLAIGFLVNGKALINPINTATGTIISGDHITTGSIQAKHIQSGTITASSACIGSLDANKITTGTVDANRISISSNQISDVEANADQTSANPQPAAWITDGGALMTKNAVDLATAEVVNKVLDNIADGATYARILKTDISAGHILLSSVSGNLDDIADGTYGKVLATDISAGHILLSSVSGNLDDIADGTYGKVLTTAISAGKIVLSSSGVTGSLPTTLSDAKCTDANADQTSANVAYDTAHVSGQPSSSVSTGAMRAYNAITSDYAWNDVLRSVVSSSPSVNGLNMTSQYMGYYYNGWRSYFDSSGNMYLSNGSYNAFYYSSSANAIAIRTGGYNNSHRLEIGSTSYPNSNWQHYYNTNYDYLSFVSGTSEYGYIRGYGTSSELDIYATGSLNLLGGLYGVLITSLSTTVSGNTVKLASQNTAECNNSLKLASGKSLYFDTVAIRGTTSEFHFWDGTHTIYFRYSGGYIQGSVDNVNWHNLW